MDKRRPPVIGALLRTMMCAATLFLLTAFPLVSFSSGAAYDCRSSPVTINSLEPELHQDICNAAERVIKFFGRLDLELTHPIAIEVVPRLTQKGGENAVGCYQEEEKEIYIVTFATFEKRGNWFGVPTTRSMYRSVVAHEVAHAIASCNFAVSEPSLHAHEFIAFTTMLATMDPVSRAEILSLHPGLVFEDESEINEVTFLFDPMFFGIAAYRYFLQEQQGDALLLRVLSGDALTNSVYDLP
jgi:hypothetical protein